MTTPLSTKPSIPGYTFGSAESAQSRLSAEDLLHIEKTVGWTGDDENLLRRHAGLFESKAEQMVDSWRAVIGAQPHLAQWFVGSDGNPDDEYKARVKARFVQWVIDVARRPHDRSWLNYQEEIGLRHTPEKKNKTDSRHTPPVVPLRYLLAFVPMVTDVRRFLEQEISDAVEQAAVQYSWEKAVHLHIVLWTRPYTKDGLW